MRDWDFSYSGRNRQATRMGKQWGVLDFVCPTEYLREIVRPHFTIFMNTIDEGRYDDTNKLFEKPLSCDIEVKKWIELNQLRNSLVDFSPGIKGIQSYLNEQFPKLVK